jgi:hypothetical protein
MDPLSYQAYRLANEGRRVRKLPRFESAVSALTKLIMLAIVLMLASFFVAQISLPAMIAVICVWSMIVGTVALFVVNAVWLRRRDR